jgi:16S rRNA (adenine1518-N6/adenine1519-N6)-dimethyltransferase
MKIIELDAEAVNYLKSHFPILDEKIIHEDFLKVNLTDVFDSKFVVIGNFPYNISSQIFFKILEYRNVVSQVVCMIQKEVAERIASPPGNKTYGILSVLLQAFYDIQYLFTVDEQVFSPPPKVKSGVIRLIRNKRFELGCNESLFFIIVKQAFNQRRKTLRNALKNLSFAGKIHHLPFLDKRAEQLSVDDFIELAKLAEKNTMNKKDEYHRTSPNN